MTALLSFLLQSQVQEPLVSPQFKRATDSNLRAAELSAAVVSRHMTGTGAVSRWSRCVFFCEMLCG